MGCEMDQTWGIITQPSTPASATEGRRWANTPALIYVWIPSSRQEQILLSKTRRILLLKVLLRWNIIRQRLSTDRTIRSLNLPPRHPFLPEYTFNLWSISRTPLWCFLFSSYIKVPLIPVLLNAAVVAEKYPPASQRIHPWLQRHFYCSWGTATAFIAHLKC